jgi:glucokinase
MGAARRPARGIATAAPALGRPVARGHNAVMNGGPHTILGADIGGTKTLLEARDRGRGVLRRRYDNDDFAGFDDLLASFLAELSDLATGPVASACLAVAGPVAAQSAALTNRPGWRVDAAAVAARHGFARCTLVNDFAAVAAGIGTLGATDTVCLQQGAPQPGGTRVALGPGTGLGVAAIANGQVLASEGGHVGFAPFDDETLGLWHFLDGHRRRVTNEHVVSGPGLVTCYRYCLRSPQDAPGPAVTPAMVVRQALADGDPAACAALALFARCFGAVAGDVALAFLARGGVYLAGGVTARVLPALQAPGFITAFNAKAGHSALAASIPVHAVLADDIGLRGALALAATTC